ncbi:hypothetical protein [Rhodanobacter sp. FW106-PBR-LB-2-19]|uniref:hypothetical protein n=1 Tax=Rhodanobacter sp. FW106-PBR-LB-2-19 TaxID=2766737 RepID=UPI0034E3B3FC
MSSPWRHAAASIETSGHLEEALILLVIPAEAGIQCLEVIEHQRHWMTSFAVVKRFLLDQPSAVEKRLAGMTNKKPVVRTILDRPRLAGR